MKTPSRTTYSYSTSLHPYFHLFHLFLELHLGMNIKKDKPGREGNEPKVNKSNLFQEWNGGD